MSIEELELVHSSAQGHKTMALAQALTEKNLPKFRCLDMSSPSSRVQGRESEQSSSLQHCMTKSKQLLSSDPRHQEMREAPHQEQLQLR